MQRKMRLRQKNSQVTTARLQRQKGSLLEIKYRVIFALKMAMILCALITAIFLWQNNVFKYTANAFENAQNSLAEKFGLIVNDIFVEGRENTQTKDILKVVNIQRGDSVYKVNPESIKTGLETLPWIRSATVQRRLNGVFYIRLAEKQPIALWQNSSKLFLIDEKGNIIDKVDPKTTKDLIIVIGEKAPVEAKKLLTQLSQLPDLYNKVMAATYVSNRRWDLILKNKVKIQLPENNIAEALTNLAKLDKQHQITDGRVLTIDIRLPDRAFLNLSPEEHFRRKNGGRGEET